MTRPDHIITVNLNTAIDRVIEVPELVAGAHAKGRQLSRYPAGKAINVSRALARIKCDSIATGFVGQGEFEMFEQFLRSTGPGRIICQLLSVRGQTRENITLIDPVLHTDTHIRDEGFEVTEADFHRMMSKIGLLARPNAVIVFCGSLPRGMDVSHFNMLLMMAMSGGARVVLDVGGDLLSKLIDLPPDASHEPLASVQDASDDGQALENPFWLVKPNQQELAQMLGLTALENDQQIAQAGFRLAKKVRQVVVTMGAAGAWLIEGTKAWRGRVEVDPDRIVNTVGCGDSMLAGLLEGYLSAMGGGSVYAMKPGESTGEAAAPARVPEEVLPAMLRRGLAVATANAFWPGVAEFDLSLVTEIEQLVQIDSFGG